MVVPVYINNVKPDSSILEACQSAGMIMKPNVCFKSASSSNCRICQIKVQDDEGKVKKVFCETKIKKGMIPIIIIFVNPNIVPIIINEMEIWVKSNLTIPKAFRFLGIRLPNDSRIYFNKDGQRHDFFVTLDSTFEAKRKYKYSADFYKSGYHSEIKVEKEMKFYLDVNLF